MIQAFISPAVVSKRQMLHVFAAILVAILLHVSIAGLFWWKPSSQQVQPPEAAPNMLEVSMVAAPVMQATELPIGALQEQSAVASQAQNPVTSADPEFDVEPLEDLVSEVVIEKKAEPAQEEVAPTPEEEIQPTPQPPQPDNSTQDSSSDQNIEHSSAPPASQAQESEVMSAPEQAALNEQAFNAEAQWQSQLQAHLERRKRYPRSAQIRRQQGVPWVRFTMDRNGNIQDVQLHKPSGVAALDREIVALVRRAEPLPKPPVDVLGDTISLAVPVAFFIQ